MQARRRYCGGIAVKGAVTIRRGRLSYDFEAGARQAVTYQTEDSTAGTPVLMTSGATTASSQPA